MDLLKDEMILKLKDREKMRFRGKDVSEGVDNPSSQEMKKS